MKGIILKPVVKGDEVTVEQKKLIECQDCYWYKDRFCRMIEKVMSPDGYCNLAMSGKCEDDDSCDLPWVENK